MFEPLSRLFRTDFMPHGYCFLWLPEVLWLHVISDVMIALAYFVIPAALLYFIARRRRDVPFPHVFLLFGTFITACGITHAFGVWTIWHATYGIEGVFKFVTALISMTTAAVIVPILPRALALPGPAELARVNRRLEREVAERRRAEHELRRGRDQLQSRVDERTAALKAANEQLRKEVQERQQAEDRLRHLAQHDALTGLPNRTLLRDRLDQAVAKARRERRRVAMMMLDLDNFKHVNDTLGHPVGDRLLCVVAERLSARLRASDTVARLGGDEFAIVQTGLEPVEGAAVLAQKLLDALSLPIEIDGHEIHTAASIGIAVCPDDAAEPEQLLAHADMAMYRAKGEGRARFQFFAPEMIRAATKRKAIEHDLRGALSRDELLVYYQPQRDVRTGRVVGAEALARWRRHGAKLTMPATFLPTAECTGLIRPLGAQVMRQACAQARSWQDAGHPLALCVNLSASQLRHPDDATEIERILDESGLDPALLNLEIREGLLADDDMVESCIDRLSELGIGFSIDDFGTGASSLAYLRRLPVRRIKIDRSYVSGIGIDPEAETIVHAMIGLGHSLDKRVVAEGIETQAQLSFLRAQECDEAQGYLCGRPMPAEQLASLLRSEHLEQSCLAS